MQNPMKFPHAYFSLKPFFQSTDHQIQYAIWFLMLLLLAPHHPWDPVNNLPGLQFCTVSTGLRLVRGVRGRMMAGLEEMYQCAKSPQLALQVAMENGIRGGMTRRRSSGFGDNGAVLQQCPLSRIKGSLSRPWPTNRKWTRSCIRWKLMGQLMTSGSDVVRRMGVWSRWARSCRPCSFTSRVERAARRERASRITQRKGRARATTLNGTMRPRQKAWRSQLGMVQPGHMASAPSLNPLWPRLPDDAGREPSAGWLAHCWEKEMSGPGNSLRFCLLVVLRVVCWSFLEGCGPLDWVPHPCPLPHSPVQLPPGDEEP